MNKNDNNNNNNNALCFGRDDDSGLSAADECWLTLHNQNLQLKKMVTNELQHHRIIFIISTLIITEYLFAYIDITSANEMERKEQERGQELLVLR